MANSEDIKLEIKGKFLNKIYESDLRLFYKDLDKLCKQVKNEQLLLCDKCNKEHHLQKLTDQAQDLGLGYD